MNLRIACIVEGEGDEQALPALARRILREQGVSEPFQVAIAVRRNRSKLVQRGQFENAVQIAARKGDCVLVVIDADEDCPVELAPELVKRARTVQSDRPIEVVLAKREYEAWFLAAASSLRGHSNLPAALKDHGEPEEKPGAKEWLTAQMPRGLKYEERTDQLALSRVLDLDLAHKNSRSFRRLWSALASLASAKPISKGKTP